MAQKLPAELLEALYDMATKLRMHSVRTTSIAKSGHPTSCSSMAEIISVLFFNVMRCSVRQPRHHANDRFILSKGHAAPILYAAWAEAGAFSISDLDNLRKLPHDLEGHPTPRLEFIDVATGSLGQGLSVAAGMAFCGKYFDQADYRVYCLLGDGETAEGAVWEALSFSSFYHLDNLCAIIDCNRLGQTRPTALAHDTGAYRRRLEAFGWNVLVVNGHSVEELLEAFSSATTTADKPTCIVAKTYKGYIFPNIEDTDGWHGKALGDKSEGVMTHLKGLLHKPEGSVPLKMKPPSKCVGPCVSLLNIELPSPPSYSKEIATRAAYGTALAKLASQHPRIIALDGDMGNSTFSEKVKEIDPQRFVECFIAEQNLIGVGIGLACRDRCVVFCSTFAAFLCRAYDQIRMAAISQSNINICGSHCGVSIGEDGPSQMALEDLAMFRAIPGCTIFYPSDAVSCERAVELAANTPGICYIRTTRPNTPVIYKADDKFAVGKAKIVAQGNEDKCLVISGGVTLHEVLKAKKLLSQQEPVVDIRVMDVFTVKPLDSEGILREAIACGGRVVTVEDHYPEGGIGEAVLSACSSKEDILVKVLAVPKIPRSGPPQDLLNRYGIAAEPIAKAVAQFLSCYCKDK